VSNVSNWTNSNYIDLTIINVKETIECNVSVILVIKLYLDFVRPNGFRPDELRPNEAGP
jgi:hypothetical protein